VVLLLCAPLAHAQDKPAPDPLGRDTPRGTITGFITAARDGKIELAAQYLNVPPKASAPELAAQLYTVLNGRLSARPTTISDRPEGSLANPLRPDEEVIGIIPASTGEVSIALERVTVKNGSRIWLFSRSTLEWVPDVYREVDLVALDRYLPRVLRHRAVGVRLFDWLLLLVVLPLLYRLLGGVDRLVARIPDRWARGRMLPGGPISTWMPGSVRLIILAALIRTLVPTVDLPLTERRLWDLVAFVFATVGIIGLIVHGIDRAETYVLRRVRRGNFAESQALLRLVRRVVQALAIAGGGVVALRYFGFDPTAALAGLGIGGIAVALAAQKTLENVIGGFSLVFDKAVRVGDFLKVDGVIGTVDHVGLRSTQIRTLDRTVVRVPNGQMAAGSIETLSLRDKFWFHHVIGLRYETTATQMRDLTNRLEALLSAATQVEAPSIRVRFLRFGPYSLDVELFAYFHAPDWEQFLAVQQDLLLRMMEIVEAVGTEIAFPSQTVHLAREGSSVHGVRNGPRRLDRLTATS
jgi:MscS family membrane protein